MSGDERSTDDNGYEGPDVELPTHDGAVPGGIPPFGHPVDSDADETD
ncbi:hypothetical protein Q9S78_08160 [Microbacterium sp. KSW-18]|uniref:Uncharacterized protein n=1 Tax=Microbacterium aquilitoris TaxID=3067307 RepID=A0ABU3GM88_9MICO|nr:hypothetical protein [Microbacterium sp. KSW-18]MDT3330644.1 hypothetical protein [Microbacterium sp. KSW-18]